MVNELLDRLAQQFPQASDFVIKPHEVVVISSKEIIYKEGGDFSREIKEVVEKFGNPQDYDTSWRTANHKFRLNIAQFGARRGTCLTFRWLKPIKWKLEDYFISEQVVNSIKKYITAKKGGVVFVIGPTGSGKSSVMATMLNYFLSELPINVITVEDPVEYELDEGKGTVLQREVGVDTSSFARGLKSALRENPNVIFVGEIRDEETVDLLVQASDTGHVCFATMHTSSAKDTLERVMGMIEPAKQDFVLQVLAKNLIGVLGMRMYDHNGRKLPLHEWLSGEDSAVKTVMLKKQFSQLPTYCQNTSKGHIPFELSFARLVQAGLVEREKAQDFGLDSSKVSIYLHNLR